MSSEVNKEYPFECDVKISFPSEKQADLTKKVMEVDEEIGNRVKKTLSIDTEDTKCLRVTFAATDAKSLRVSVSSFYDYLSVALQCFDEFDHDVLEDGAHTSRQE